MLSEYKGEFQHPFRSKCLIYIRFLTFSLIMKNCHADIFFTFKGCSLVVNGETDKILGVVVRVSFP